MAEALFYAILFGAVVGAFYDLLRFLRLTLNDKFVFDFLFCIALAVAFYCYLLVFTNGVIRIIYPLFSFAGFLLYIFTLGSITKRAEKALSQFVKKQLKKLKKRVKSFKKVLQFPYIVYYNTKEHIKGTREKKETEMTKQDTKNNIISFFSENRKKLFLFTLAVILAGTFVFLGITLIKNTSDIKRLEIQKQEISAQYEAQEQANKELIAVLDNEDKDSYIEQKAREKGYAKSNEIVFYDISASE